jgi:hypothetical protein
LSEDYNTPHHGCEAIWRRRERLIAGHSLNTAQGFWAATFKFSACPILDRPSRVCAPSRRRYRRPGKIARNYLLFKFILIAKQHREEAPKVAFSHGVRYSMLRGRARIAWYISAIFRPHKENLIKNLTPSDERTLS